ncbi:Uma2 family endonuclease [Haliangium sp.]|uniref:Uma2 family endonuclease n=1 Tax=Haliangium sp. TaxID=2663208 RepID=UPI003D0EF91D
MELLRRSAGRTPATPDLDSAADHDELTPPYGVAMSLEAWADLPEDATGELVAGRLMEAEMPGYAHEYLLALVLGALRDWLVPRGGFCAGSGVRFAVAPNTGRMPDASAFLPGRRPPAQGLVRTPPDVAVEILSPRPRDVRRDRIAKMNEYAAFGVRWFWLIDPEARVVEIFELGDDGRYIRALAAAGAIEQVPGCPGLRLGFDAWWAELDRLAE